MEQEQSLGGLRADLEAVLAQDRREPQGFPGALHVVDLDLASARVHDDEPHQPGSHHEPDDEQPYVELGIHPPEV